MNLAWYNCIMLCKPVTSPNSCILPFWCFSRHLTLSLTAVVYFGWFLHSGSSSGDKMNSLSCDVPVFDLTNLKQSTLFPDELLSCLESVFCFIFLLHDKLLLEYFWWISLWIRRQNIIVDFRIHSAASIMSYIISKYKWTCYESSNARPSQDTTTFSAMLHRWASTISIISISFHSPHFVLSISLVV